MPAISRQRPPRVLGLIWLGAALNLMLLWLAHPARGVVAAHRFTREDPTVASDG
jgi:hypothetical protein